MTTIPPIRRDLAQSKRSTRDYSSDPYSSLEEREAALGWVAVVAQASGVAELGRIKFREGIRVPTRHRDSFGQHPRAGQA